MCTVNACYKGEIVYYRGCIYIYIYIYIYISPHGCMIISMMIIIIF